LPNLSQHHHENSKPHSADASPSADPDSSQTIEPIQTVAPVKRKAPTQLVVSSAKRPALLSSSNPATTASGCVATESDASPRYFTILFTKKSPKKNKVYDDGVISITKRSLTLKNSEVSLLLLLAFAHYVMRLCRILVSYRAKISAKD